MRVLSAVLIVALAQVCLADADKDRAEARKLYASHDLTKACTLFETVSKKTSDWTDYLREAQCKLALSEELIQSGNHLEEARSALESVVNRLGDVQRLGTLEGDQGRLLKSLQAAARLALNRVVDVIGLMQTGARSDDARKRAEAELSKSQAHSKELALSVAERDVAVATARADEATAEEASVEQAQKCIAMTRRAISAERKLAELEITQADAAKKAATEQRDKAQDKAALDAANKALAEADATTRAATESRNSLDAESSALGDDEAKVAARKRDADKALQDRNGELEAAKKKLNELRSGRI